MTQPHDPKLVPAFAVAPHVIDPSGAIAAWWTDPPGALMQFARAGRGTTEMAEWLVGPGFDLLLSRFPGASDLRVVLDMRQMTGRSATARSLLLQRGRNVAGHIGHVVLLPSVHLGAAYVKIVEATALMLRMGGLRVDVELGLERVIAEHGLRPATSVGVDLASELAREARTAPQGPRGHAR